MMRRLSGSVSGALASLIGSAVKLSASWRLLTVSVCALAITAGIGLSAAPALAVACPNEAVRHEGNVDPVTGQPYDLGLPDCRAYELVSPPYKQSFPAKTVSIGIPAAPGGEAAGWEDEGDFGEPQNYTAGAYSPALKYVSQRGSSAWTTTSTFAPARYVILPTIEAGLNSDFPPDLRSSQASCGVQGIGNVRPLDFKGYACAVRHQGTEWTASGLFPTLGLVETTSASGSYLGGSADMSRVFIQPVTASLLENDNVMPVGSGSHGIYEVSHVGSGSGQLRLVDVDNAGLALGILRNNREENNGPLIGDEREVEPHVVGTAYHAISTTGETVFFTATPDTPTGSPTLTEGSEVLTVYARRACASGPACAEERETTEQEFKEGETKQVKRRTCAIGPPCVDGRETVAVSNPSLNESDPRLEIENSGRRWGCKACLPESEPERIKKEAKGENSATFQGASADGSKVFFTTKQQLLEKEVTPTPNLYEYDLEPCKAAGRPCVPNEPGELTLISRAPAGAKVKGVVRTSSDGGVVYFVAGGVLPAAPSKIVNAEGKVVSEPEPVAGSNNLYAYDTNSKKLKFVAVDTPTPNEAKELGGVTESFDSLLRHAQTTPDGHVLVFDSAGGLAGSTNGSKTQAVYRYDFETGELTWVSRPAPGCAGEGCAVEEKSAWVAALPGTQIGAEADIEDWNRAISGCPEGTNESERAECPSGTHDGEYIIFTTPERLQDTDENEVTDVYEWHCPSACPNPTAEGVVSLISDGTNAEGSEGNGVSGTGALPSAAISASGADVFFLSASSLVGQDQDRLTDVYDARIGGGFPRPSEPVACSGEACQGEAASSPSFGTATSSISPAGGNLVAPGGSTLSFQTATPKPLTMAQKLANALKACDQKRNRKARAACQRLARRRYAPKGKAKGKTSRPGKKALKARVS